MSCWPFLSSARGTNAPRSRGTLSVTARPSTEMIVVSTGLAPGTYSRVAQGAPEGERCVLGAAVRSSPAWSRRARRRAGRLDALPSPPRSAGSSWPAIGLPREESRCLLQDLPLFLEHAHALSELAQLGELLARQVSVKVSTRSGQPHVRQALGCAPMSGDCLVCRELSGAVAVPGGFLWQDDEAVAFHTPPVEEVGDPTARAPR